jgi:hypothetical protein
MHEMIPVAGDCREIHVQSGEFLQEFPDATGVFLSCNVPGVLYSHIPPGYPAQTTITRIFSSCEVIFSVMVPHGIIR